jgi:hypothetical protein
VATDGAQQQTHVALRQQLGWLAFHDRISDVWGLVVWRVKIVGRAAARAFTLSL